MTIKTRLNKLEKRIGSEVEGLSVFILTNVGRCGRDEADATGWTTTTKGGREITVKAEPGETKEALQARTLQEVAPFRARGQTMFFSELKGDGL